MAFSDTIFIFFSGTFFAFSGVNYPKSSRGKTSFLGHVGLSARENYNVARDNFQKSARKTHELPLTNPKTTICHVVILVSRGEKKHWFRPLL